MSTRYTTKNIFSLHSPCKTFRTRTAGGMRSPICNIVKNILSIIRTYTGTSKYYRFYPLRCDGCLIVQNKKKNLQTSYFYIEVPQTFERHENILHVMVKIQKNFNLRFVVSL